MCVNYDYNYVPTKVTKNLGKIEKIFKSFAHLTIQIPSILRESDLSTHKNSNQIT
jgi:hypothetical protein